MRCLTLLRSRSLLLPQCLPGFPRLERKRLELFVYCLCIRGSRLCCWICRLVFLCWRIFGGSQWRSRDVVRAVNHGGELQLRLLIQEVKNGSKVPNDLT